VDQRTFRLTDPALRSGSSCAAQAGLVNLKHRSIGGLRASIYNAMPAEGVETLVEFMTDFERRVLHDADAEATS
jgi:phosphoserine aminotransferase